MLYRFFQSFFYILLFLSNILLISAFIIKDTFGSPTLSQILFHMDMGNIATSDIQFSMQYVFYFILLNFITFTLVYFSKSKLLPINKGTKILHYCLAPFLFSFACVVWLSFFQGFSLIKNTFFYNDTDFIAENYVPFHKNILQFQEKKNLVVIFAESVEATFMNKELFGKNLLPNLTQFASKNIQLQKFKQVYGTGWTMAGMVAYFSGIPLYNSIGNHGYRLEKFLPGTIDLPQILKKNGYNFRFYKGTSKSFAGFDRYAKTHGFNDEILGFHELVKKYSFEGIINNWGLYDSVLFQMAQKEFMYLKNENKPFCFFIETINTHTPGYQEPNAVSQYGSELSGVIQQSDLLIYEFIKWIESQDTKNETVIVVLSDHLYMFGGDVYQALSSYPLDKRDNLFILHNAKPFHNLNRTITSFDVFPTLIEAVGGELRNGALGLGRSIYHDNQTLIEIYGRKSLRDFLMQPSAFYENELQGEVLYIAENISFEEWGFWSNNNVIKIKRVANAPFPKNFELTLDVVQIFGENNIFPVKIKIGKEEQERILNQKKLYSFQFKNDEQLNLLEIVIPKPVSLATLGHKDSRKLGYGFSMEGIKIDGHPARYDTYNEQKHVKF